MTGLIFRVEKRSAQASAYPLSQAQGGLFYVLTGRVDCVCLWDTRGANVCSMWRSVKPFYSFFVVVLVGFSSLENYFGFRTTKRIIPSVWGGINVLNIFKKASIFLIIVHSSCELILSPVLRFPSPGWIKSPLYSVISSYGYFFYMPRFFNLPSRCRTSFIPVFSQRTILLTHASEQTCALKTFSEIEGQQAYSRRKEYFDPFSVSQVVIVRSFIFVFTFNY